MQRRVWGDIGELGGGVNGILSVLVLVLILSDIGGHFIWVPESVIHLFTMWKICVTLNGICEWMEGEEIVEIEGVKNQSDSVTKQRFVRVSPVLIAEREKRLAFAMASYCCFILVLVPG
jgi:hypothetical protein